MIIVEIEPFVFDRSPQAFNKNGVKHTIVSIYTDARVGGVRVAYRKGCCRLFVMLFSTCSDLILADLYVARGPVFRPNYTIVDPGAFRTNFAGDANMRPATPIDAYQPVTEPLRHQYLYGNNGKQPGDPAKAAHVMIQVVESDDPPLRVILGADAYDGWEKKYGAMSEELTKWRSVGEATAFEGAENRPVGG